MFFNGFGEFLKNIRDRVEDSRHPGHPGRNCFMGVPIMQARGWGGEGTWMAHPRLW